MTAALAYPFETETFERVVAHYRRRVTLIAFQITRDIDDAQDVAQHVFLQMYRRMPLLLDERGVERWLYIVTRNAAVHVARRRSQDAAALQLARDEFANRGPEDTVLSNERAREVRELIARLPPDDRDVIELRYLRALSTDEIAAHCGVPARRVKRDVQRAKWRLRNEIVRDGMDVEI